MWRCFTQRVAIPLWYRSDSYRGMVSWGWYYKKRDRYHLVLQSDGSRMKSGDEECIWHAGELWWFNNKAPH